MQNGIARCCDPDRPGRELPDVVEHYSRVRKLRLSDAQKRDLVEYLETL